MDGNKAIFGVHAHRDLIAVLLQHPGRERKIRHGHAAQDAAPHAEGEIFFDPLLGADAATHLDVQAALLCQRGNGVIVGEGTVFCAVQIDNVEIFCPCGHKLPRLGAGVGAVDGHFIVIALGQADDLTIPQVNGGIEFHDISSQFCKRL